VADRSNQEGIAAGKPAAEESLASSGPQLVMPVLNALEQHNHLLVTGEPGAGKSTMSSYLAHRLSRLWLREDSAVDAPITEPVVPLRVSARSLDGSGSWSAVLAKAACDSLGRSLLEDPDPGLFAGRVQGARWLVLVDGLDEIPDPRLRADVIRSIAQHARPGSDYRFVVTTRDLPESELAPLRTATVGSYVMEPFGRPELAEFATKWFTAQQVPSPEAETERFLRETSDGRLGELVRNPLLATIAAVSAVKDPNRPLPASRISLYERFCSYLTGDRSGQRNPLAQLRRHHEDNPELLACIRWLHQIRLGILSALARRWLESQDTLWQAAVDWVRDQEPDNVTLVDGWEDHLGEELVGTGLLIGRERELRFLHRSFAEFLAAHSHAETIGDNVDELDTWIRRGLREADRGQARLGSYRYDPAARTPDDRETGFQRGEANHRCRGHADPRPSSERGRPGRLGSPGDQRHPWATSAGGRGVARRIRRNGRARDRCTGHSPTPARPCRQSSTRRLPAQGRR
jgi:predicted NACHT family NTPase